MSGIRHGWITADVTWPGLVNLLIKRYLTEDVLGAAYEAVTTVTQGLHETKNTFADRLETLAYRCTAVFTDAALVNYFIRGLRPEIRDAVAESSRRLPMAERADYSTIRRIATAEGNTYRARFGEPLMERSTHVPKPTTSVRTTPALYINRPDRTAPSSLIAGNAGLIDAPPGARFDPVLFTSGLSAIRNAGTETTTKETFDTALEASPGTERIDEIDVEPH